MSPIHSRPANHPDGIKAVSGCSGAVASEVADGRRTRRSRMAEKVPVKSCAQYDRYESEWRASVFESSYADVLIRTFKYGRTPFRFVSVVLSAGFDRNFLSHSGSTRAPSVSNFGGNCS